MSDNQTGFRPERSPVQEQIAEGIAILTREGVGLDEAAQAVAQLHPEVEAQAFQVMVAAAYARDWDAAPEPKGRDEIAKSVANRSGAFSWDGPVGNGLTLADYRAAFLKMAGPVVEFARLVDLRSRQ